MNRDVGALDGRGVAGAGIARGSGVHVKICGVTSADDAVQCVEAGASAIGVNLVAESPRRVDVSVARAIADAVGKEAIVVAVVRDLSIPEMVALRERVACGCLQLHGSEPPESLLPLLPHAYKAIAIATRADVLTAERYAGEFLLVDAKTDAGSGGMGKVFDWSLVQALARARKVILAGGLTPENVAEAVRMVLPHTVDVASGVEQSGRPRQKDLGRVRAFVAAAKGR